jgi:AcrR family transcriptional regulator
MQDALLELVVEKGFAAVTVRDICERATVNRSTFYRHYLDKYDLLNQYVDQLQQIVTEAAFLAEKTAQTTAEKVPAGLLLLIQHVQEHADFYRVMLGQNGDAMFTRRFRQMAENRYRRLFAQEKETKDPAAPPIDMRIDYISCAGVGAILWWLENNQPCTAEQLALWLGQLNMTTAGLFGQ